MKFDLNILDFIEKDINKDKLAISGSDRDLTWDEFKEEVEKLKKQLTQYNLPKGHPIIIYGHKEVKFIVAITTCLSLRLPYIPIDNVYPVKRMLKIQKIIKSALVIKTDSDTIDYNKEYANTSYFIENDPIIYIIFTSGSTGNPKGVQITHKAVLSFTDWIQKDFPFNEDDIFFNQAPFSFDLSTYELFSFLIYGSSVVLFSKDIKKNSENFITRLKKYSCNICIATPSLLLVTMMHHNFNSKNLSKLDKFVLNGEQLTHKVVKKFLKLFKDAELYNTYGPSEATNAVTLIKIDKAILDKYDKILPVGYIKYSSEVNILDIYEEDGKLIGEVEIVGDNVSIGYFNNDELNREKFNIKSGKRALKTGDFGYFEDNMLFLTGRKDDMIKFHGYRIELGEIDREIEKNDNITASVTIPFNRGSEIVKLVSFVLIKDNNADLSKIKKNIAVNLPYYMIPADIVKVDHIPYTANHKINKKKLKEMY